MVIHMDEKQQNDLALLREVLARELDTISQYERASFSASDKRLQAFFRHLAREEKEHVSEAMALVHEYDAEQKQEWDETNTSADHFEMGKKSHPSAVVELRNDEPQGSLTEPVSGASSETPLSTVSTNSYLTVGSLIGKHRN